MVHNDGGHAALGDLDDLYLVNRSYLRQWFQSAEYVNARVLSRNGLDNADAVMCTRAVQRFTGMEIPASAQFGTIATHYPNER